MHVKGRSHTKFKFPNLILTIRGEEFLLPSFSFAFKVIKKYYPRKVFSEFMTLKVLLKKTQKVELHFVFTEASKGI